MKALIKSYSKAELRELYGCSATTLWRNLQQVQGLPKNAKLLMPSQVEKIFEILGHPETKPQP